MELSTNLSKLLWLIASLHEEGKIDPHERDLLKELVFNEDPKVTRVVV